jgi:hypothetical protein
MKTFWILFLMMVAFTSCKHGRSDNVSQKDLILLGQKDKRNSIDKYIRSHRKAVITLVKIPGKTELVIVKNEQWPDEVEYTYSVYKDGSGEIIFIAQTPFSESGDWNVVYKHYFDGDGNTCAFSKLESLFDDGVKGGIVRELLTNYYDKNFKILKQIDKLTDQEYKPVKKSKNDFNFRNDKYEVYKDAKECLAGYNIKLPN